MGQQKQNDKAVDEAGSELGQPEQAPTYHDAISTVGHMPTIQSPFDFPTYSELPAYKPLAGSFTPKQNPIAIPQSEPRITSHFISAYPPALLSVGITEGTWRSFLETISAFLDAKVSERAISHASDMAKKLGRGPARFGKDMFSHVKSVSMDIVGNAKSGDTIGVSTGIIGGAISIPVYAAVGAAATILALPGASVDAIISKPQTPLERAAAYSTVANKTWLNGRGLNATLLDTTQLAEAVGLSASKLIQVANNAKSEYAAGKLRALERYIGKLQVDEGEKALLAPDSLWLVLLPVNNQDKCY